PTPSPRLEPDQVPLAEGHRCNLPYLQGFLPLPLDDEVIGGPPAPPVHPPAWEERPPEGGGEGRVGVVYPVVLDEAEPSPELSLSASVLGVQGVLLHQDGVPHLYHLVRHDVGLSVARADEPALAILPRGSTPAARLRLYDGEGFLRPVVHTSHDRGADAEEVTSREPIGDARGQRLPYQVGDEDRKSTRLNASHGSISYAVFCVKKKYGGIGDGVC